MSASKILVPIGFSEQSMVALDQAFSLAKIKKSDVVLLSVIREQSVM
jgi:nucleotide-binding universal stress UspA family protein